MLFHNIKFLVLANTCIFFLIPSFYVLKCLLLFFVGMHELFSQVLTKKDLSKAGELFSLEDADIKNDLTEVLERICDIARSPEYASNDNDQSVVEICITRVTTAIR